MRTGVAGLVACPCFEGESGVPVSEGDLVGDAILEAALCFHGDIDESISYGAWVRVGKEGTDTALCLD